MDSNYLSPTAIIDSDQKDVMEFAATTVGDRKDPEVRAVSLYYAVRDGIWYDPYYPFYLPEHYRASNILKSGRGYCVCKASLLCALGRACGIPSRVGFAHVRNHLATRQLIEFLGTDIFAFHGFTEFHIQGRWVKATPAFNRELCERHRVAPLEFNGREDSLFQPYNLEKRQFMEYIEYLGTYSDIPVETILKGWKDIYGEKRVQDWIAMHEKGGEKMARDFNTEDVWK